MKSLLPIILCILSFQFGISQDITTYPYSTSFEGQEGTLNENFPENWTAQDLNVEPFGNQGWQIIKNTPTAQNARTDSTAVHMFSHGSETNNDWLFTPSFQAEQNWVPGSIFTLTFWYRIESFGSTSEKLRVYAVDTNDAATIISSSVQPIWENDNITNTTYQMASVEFIPQDFNNYYFAFQYYSNEFEFILLMDDVTITQGFFDSVNTLDSNEDYQVLSNPVKDQIRLEFPDGITSDAKAYLYDISGKLVSETELENQTAELEILTNGLTNGMYILHILSDDQSWQIRERISIAK